MRKLVVALTLLTFSSSSAPASDLIRKACLKSGRSAATPDTCLCIQRVANARLRRGEQRLAASFFRNPAKAQVIRQSDRPDHEVFWVRYKAWATEAEDTCAKKSKP